MRRPTAARPHGGSVGVLDGVSRRVVTTVTIWLLLCTVVAWVLTVREATGMVGMVGGLAQIGTAMPMALTAPAFIAMWVGMTTAMMFPTVVPMVAAHRVVTRRRGYGPVATLVFVVAYLMAWTATGVLPLIALFGFRHVSATAGDQVWLTTVAGIAVAAAGAYQFTGWKSVCLRTCRSPMAFLMSHDFNGGSRTALRAGLVYGGYCLGCCWALMSLLLVVGLMNLVWMAALAIVFLAEKCWSHGAGLTRIVGATLIVVGALIVVKPTVLDTLAGIMVTQQPGM
jgi:predicted metal-binding membrane protein